MSRLLPFLAYTAAFEHAYATDEWSAIEPFFTLDASRCVRDGGPLDVAADGRRALVESFHDAVAGIDRRFDRRIPEILDGPWQRGESVFMRWRLTLQRAGLPDLQLEGDHRVDYAGDGIARLEETIAPGVARRAEAYLREHGAALHPAARSAADVAATLPPPGREVGEAAMRTLVRVYGAAKSQQDVTAALALCHESFALETVSMGIAARDRAAAEAQLRLFFRAFPDYAVRLDGLACDAESATLACWGEASLTLAGELLGIAATGRRATLPIFCTFAFRDGLLSRERFFFDLAALCEGVGVPLARMQDALRGARGAAAADRAA